MHRLLVPRALALGALACSRPSVDSGAAPPPSATSTAVAANEAKSCADLFSAPPGAVKLCDQHEMGADAEIHWTSWAVRTAPMETLSPYQRRASACGASIVTKPPELTLSKDESRLTVHDARATGYPSCQAKPDASKQSVVVISVLTKR